MKRIAILLVSACLAQGAAPAAQSDLDDFMASVLAVRDDNWKKLQQYILDEREQVEVTGPDRARLWGDRRDYTWFIRDGFFVRSPVRANGVAVPDADRRRYEDDFLRHARERDARAQQPGANADKADAPVAADGAEATAEPPPATMEGVLAQTRRPQFIDAAYFLRFRFEPGHYALVGREAVDGRETLRIEYYPARLFTHEQDTESTRRREGRRDGHEDVEASLERMMNKVSLVTLWVDPAARQIVRYTFDNVDLDFLPGAWLLRVDEMRASMAMSQPFAGVWLPRAVDVRFGGLTAIGAVGVAYHLDYDDYREATSSGRVILPAGR